MTAKRKTHKKHENELQRLVEDFLEYLEIERNCSPLTRRNYKHYLNRFVEWVDSYTRRFSLEKLSLEQVMKYMGIFSQI